MKKWQKKIKYSLAEPILGGYLSGLMKTTKRSMTGYEHIQSLIDDQQPFIPCFWHQDIMGCSIFMLDWLKQGFNAGFLVSPSNDGNVAAHVFERHGAIIIRGSTSRTGAAAIRDLYQAVKKDHISPAHTPDGPRGPIYDFKTGPVMLAQMTGVPIVLMAAKYSRFWQLKSWDRFILPKWFSRISLSIGEPIYIDKKTPIEELGQLASCLQKKLLKMN